MAPTEADPRAISIEGNSLMPAKVSQIVPMIAIIITDPRTIIAIRYIHSSQTNGLPASFLASSLILIKFL